MSFDTKPKVLIIAMEYYPIHNANTAIIKKMVSQLSDRFDFVIATQNISNGPEKEKVFGIPVVRTSFHAFNNRERTNNNSLFDIAKMLYLKGLSELRGDDVNQKDVYYFIYDICKKLNITDFDLILSFSNPFLAHYSAGILAKKYSIPWIAYYLDPFFSNATLDKKAFLKRKLMEEKTLEFASKILLTYPINENYIKLGISFHKKILMAEMPGISTVLSACEGTISHQKCKCFFIGNLYKGIRTPETVIKAFSLLANDDVELFFAGGFDKEFLDLLKGVSGNIHFLGRKTAEEVLQIYKDADILVNIGNSIDNQIPSKIFEYISTGKPIINFYKTATCPTLKYLKKYPIALNIFEEDFFDDIDKNIKQIKEFCIRNKGNTVSGSFIKKNFNSNTDEEVANYLGEQINKVLQENK